MEKREKAKPAYMITSGVVTDPGKMAKYLEMSAPLFEKAGAEELAYGHENNDSIALLEGDWELPGLVMILKFPSMVELKEFWYSPEYQAAKKFRDEGVVDPNFTIAIEDRD